LFHVGHARYLDAARQLGDYLVVAMNSDASTARLKGLERPILPQDQRARILASFAVVDLVTIFDEDDPKPLLHLLRPEVLVKGGNYGVEGVVGREMVEAYGGAVLTMALTEGASTTNLVETILRKSDALPRDYSG